MVNRQLASANGKLAEATAAKFLGKQGLKLIEKNFYCRFGEIDLIMHNKNNLIFVEVKFRSNNFYGAAIEMLTANKIKKIIAAAYHYLLQKEKYQAYNCRFDLVTITAKKDFKDADIDWIPSAFTA